MNNEYCDFLIDLLVKNLKEEKMMSDYYVKELATVREENKELKAEIEALKTTKNTNE